MLDELARQRHREAGRRYRERHRDRDLARKREWRQQNRELANRLTREWRARNREVNRERDREAKRKDYRENPEKYRAYWLKFKYGISTQRYDEMLVAQGGTCAFTSCTESSDLGVDHDHATGEVRGLLCDRHNSAIGFLRENLDELEDARAYLLKYRRGPRGLRGA